MKFLSRTFTLSLLLAAQSWAATDSLKLLSHQAKITAPQAGVSRVTLSPEVMALTQSDLSDVRIVDSDGREIPYMVDRGSPAPALKRVEATVISLNRDMHQKAGELESRTEIAKLKAPASTMTGPLRLTAETQANEWVADVTITWKGGSLKTVWFRLADGRSHLSVTLPQVPTSDLTLTIQALHDTFVLPHFYYEETKSTARELWTEVPLAQDRAESRQQTTTLWIKRPSGYDIGLLSFQTESTLFERYVRVYDVDERGNEDVIGGDNLFRIGDRSLLSLPVRTAHGKFLKLEIDNGDSPALTELKVSARVTAPVVVFDLRGTEATMMFGAGRLRKPTYDLQSLLSRGTAGIVIQDAQLGSPTKRTEYQPERPVEFAVTPGALLDVAPYAFCADLNLTAGAEGVSRIELSPEWTSRMRPDLADVRLVDDEKHQWPYLLSLSEADSPIEVDTEERTQDHGDTTWKLKVRTTDAVVVRQLDIHAEGVFTDRPYRVEIDKKPAFQGTLRFNSQTHVATVPLEMRRLQNVTLIISDGDDVALDLNQVTAQVETPALYTVAKAGHYQLLAGFANAEAPHYQLETARALVLNAKFENVTPSFPGKNPNFSKASLYKAMGDTTTVWIALGIAIAVLAMLTLRLARTPTAPSSAGAASEPARKPTE